MIRAIRSGLIASVSAETGTVLIVGHSNTVPDIVEKLGGQRPDDLSHEDFGDIWHIAGPEKIDHAGPHHHLASWPAITATPPALGAHWRPVPECS